MADAPDNTKSDYRSTVFLPRTDFPMKAGLPQKEPAISARWAEQDLYGKKIEVALHAFIREEKRFDEIEPLIAHMREDEAKARHLLALE